MKNHWRFLEDKMTKQQNDLIRTKPFRPHQKTLSSYSEKSNIYISAQKIDIIQIYIYND